MSIVIFKPARAVMVDGVRRIVSNHEQWHLFDTQKDFHSRFGIIKKEDLKPGTLQLGNETFFLVPGSFIDKYKSMRRKAQIITRKDAGFILGFCGLTKESVIVESGIGSGGATLLFASLCKHVYSFEIEEENIEVARSNVEMANLQNVTITKADFYDSNAINVSDADLVLLDLPEPWLAYASAKKAVSLGGYVVAYTPSIIQAARFVNDLPEEFLHERTVEIIDRDWKIKGDAVRPMNTEIGHTAFLTFTRRIV